MGNEVLRKFLEENEEFKKKEKAETLMKLGLYMKEYKPEGFKENAERVYPHLDENNCYFRYVPLNVSDEVYIQILKLPLAKHKLNEKLDDEPEIPLLAGYCYFFAILVLILGCLSMIILGINMEKAEIIIAGLLVPPISVLPIFAMAEILKYLDKINKKL